MFDDRGYDGLGLSEEDCSRLKALRAKQALDHEVQQRVDRARERRRLARKDLRDHCAIFERDGLEVWRPREHDLDGLEVDNYELAIIGLAIWARQKGFLGFEAPATRIATIARCAESVVWERIRRLEAAGIIIRCEGYRDQPYVEKDAAGNVVKTVERPRARNLYMLGPTGLAKFGPLFEREQFCRTFRGVLYKGIREYKAARREEARRRATEQGSILRDAESNNLITEIQVDLMVKAIVEPTGSPTARRRAAPVQTRRRASEPPSETRAAELAAEWCGDVTLRHFGLKGGGPTQG